MTPSTTALLGGLGGAGLGAYLGSMDEPDPRKRRRNLLLGALAGGGVGAAGGYYGNRVLSEAWKDTKAKSDPGAAAVTTATPAPGESYKTRQPERIPLRDYSISGGVEGLRDTVKSNPGLIGAGGVVGGTVGTVVGGVRADQATTREIQGLTNRINQVRADADAAAQNERALFNRATDPKARLGHIDAVKNIRSQRDAAVAAHQKSLSGINPGQRFAGGAAKGLLYGGLGGAGGMTAIQALYNYFKSPKAN